MVRRGEGEGAYEGGVGAGGSDVSELDEQRYIVLPKSSTGSSVSMLASSDILIDGP